MNDHLSYVCFKPNARWTGHTTAVAQQGKHQSVGAAKNITVKDAGSGMDSLKKSDCQDAFGMPPQKQTNKQTSTK